MSDAANEQTVSWLPGFAREAEEQPVVDERPLFAEDPVRRKPTTAEDHTPVVPGGRLVEVAGVPGYAFHDQNGVEQVRLYGSLLQAEPGLTNTPGMPIPPDATGPASPAVGFEVILGGFEARGAWGTGSDITPLERHLSVNALHSAAQVLQAGSASVYAESLVNVSGTPHAVGQTGAIPLEAGSVPLQASWPESQAADSTSRSQAPDLAKNAKDKASIAGEKASELLRKVDKVTWGRRIGKAAKIWLYAGVSVAVFSTLEGIPAAGFHLIGIGQPSPYVLNADPMHDAHAIVWGPVDGTKAVVHVGKGIMHIVGVL